MGVMKEWDTSGVLSITDVALFVMFLADSR